jgi:hypothetical protein
MADLIKAPINYAVSAGGQFVKGGSVLFGVINIRPDAANPATLKPIYLDSALTLQAANPQGLSSDAVFDQSNNGVLFGADDDSYSVIIYDANGEELSYIPVYQLSDATAAASAQTAASEALVSASEASDSEIATNLSYEEFINRYLGSYATDPTVDPAGNPPIEGSLYWSSGSAAFKVFTMGAWQFTNLTFGTAAYVDVGTDSDQIPLNSDLGTASLVNTGTGADQLPTNAQIRNPRNRIVNPSMAISQENGFDTQVVSSGLGYYIADQWDTFESGTNGVITAEFGELAGSRSIKLTATTAATDLSGGNQIGRLRHQIVGSDVFDLNGKTAVKAFVVNTNWTGKYPLAFYNSGGTRSYVTDVDVVSGINLVFVTVPFEADTFLTNDNNIGLQVRMGTNNEGSSRTSITDAWQAGFFTCSTVSTQWAKTINNYVEITNVDLYAGNVPREFVPNSYAQDLFECQRYFEQLAVSPVTGSRYASGYQTSSTAAQVILHYAVKRATPVITVPVIANWSIGNSTSAITLSSFTNAAINPTTTISSVTWSGASGAAGNAVMLRSIGTSSSIQINARL